jgi:GAF domain-containing protein
MTGDRGEVFLVALEAVASRAAAAGRLEPAGGEAVLRAVAETTVTLFDAEAASILLHEPETDRLAIRVAAGRAAAGAVGIAIPSSEGIAGYVFTTGQPLAVSDVSTDPRFDRAVAEATGYVPRSILAVPLLDDSGSIGVLEVLDRHGDGGFGLRELDVATLLARQATVAIRASRVERDVTELLRRTLIRLAEHPDTDREALEAAVAGAAIALDGEDGSSLWVLADAVARARNAAPDQVGLVVEILDALARRASRPSPRSFRR